MPKDTTNPLTPEEIAAAEVAELRAGNSDSLPKGIDPELVAEKVRAGLTPVQAIEVINNQRAHDEALAKTEPAKAKK